MTSEMKALNCGLVSSNSWANEGGGAISCGIDNTLGEFRGYLGKAANKPSGPSGTNLRK
ncbi:hypothetical protein IAF22_20440, partial [Acinetobacter baumannii]|nr:hypothetical protein [Acinetobacter baumannii]